MKTFLVTRTMSTGEKQYTSYIETTFLGLKIKHWFTEYSYPASFPQTMSLWWNFSRFKFNAIWTLDGLEMHKYINSSAAYVNKFTITEKKEEI